MRSARHRLPVPAPHPEDTGLPVFSIRAHDLYGIPYGKLVLLMDDHGTRSVPGFFPGFFNDSEKNGIAGIGVVGIDHGLRIRPAEIKSCREIAVGTFADLPAVPVHSRGIFFIALQVIVNGAPVSAGDRRDIEGSLHTSLDLEAVDPGPGKLGQMIDHTQVAGIKDIGTSFVLFDRQVFPGPALFRHRIFPSAGMGTGAPVGIPPRKPGGKKTSSRIGNTHRAVDKGFDLQIPGGILPDLGDLPQRKLPGTYHSGSAKAVPEAESPVIGTVGLCRDMDRDPRAVLPGKHKHAGVSNKDRVRPYPFQKFKIGLGLVQILVVCVNISGDMDPHAPLMGIGDPLAHIIGAEIARLRPQAEGLTPDIDRVRSEIDRRPQDLQILCGDQKLRLRSGCLPSFFHFYLF